MNSQNNNEKCIQANAESTEYALRAPSKSSKKKSTFEILVNVVLIILCFALFGAEVFLLSIMSESRNYEFSEYITPQPFTAETISSRAETVSVDDIPKSYVESLPVFNFSEPVPESEDVGTEYFNDTVFIGDSRTQGLIMYTGISPAFDYSAQGASTLSVRTKAYIAPQDDKGVRASTTLAESLTIEKGNYKAIFISLGINELGWSSEVFIDSFKSLINDIREITDTPIYIQLILPVTSKYAENSKYGVTNEKQRAFNEQLVALSAEMEVFFLDPTPLFTLEDGSLDTVHTLDGAHLTPKAYELIANYYRTHTVDITKYSNTHPDRVK